MPCVACPDGQFSTPDASKCQDWTLPCGTGQNETVAPTPARDRQCADCPAGSYRAVGMSLCLDCEVCGTGYHASRVCTNTLVGSRIPYVLRKLGTHAYPVIGSFQP